MGKGQKVERSKGQEPVLLRNRKRLHRNLRGGFTLVESIATIVILGAIGLVASGIMMAATDGYIDASANAQLHAELSIALDRAAREVRMIALDPDVDEETIAPDIDTVTATSIVWRNSDDEVSTLALSGSNLTLSIEGGAAAILLSDVTNFSVKAYDEDNSAMAASLSGAACDDIRRIELTIVTQRYGVSETLRTKVFLRSTMTRAGVAE